jgi:hypothetical protein
VQSRTDSAPSQCDGEAAPIALAERLVVRQREGLALPVIPELPEGLLQERQHPRLGPRVGQQLRDKLGLQVDSDVARGMHNRLAQRLAAQRPDAEVRQPSVP